MKQKLFNTLKSLVKPLLIFTLAFSLIFSQADGALAARSGGRAGGSRFSAPSRSVPSRPYTQPGGGYGGGGYGYGYPGGGFGFPLIWPLFFGGGGSLFTILIVIAIGGFLVRTFRSFQSSGESYDGYGYSTASSTVSVAKVQVGLLAQARSLQTDLDRITRTADTSSAEGLTLLLQETTLSLLRHPEYWVYAGVEEGQSRLEGAEDAFNRLSLAERSKFSTETLSNVNNALRQANVNQSLPAAGGELAPNDLMQGPGEYIVVTLLVATQGKLQLPAVNSSQDLRKALGQMGAIGSDNLLAVEVLWTPQAEGDVLTTDDMVSAYPDLKLV